MSLQTPDKKTALIVGTSGLVGSHLLQQLLASPAYSKVISAVRSSSGITHPNLQEIIVDFDELKKSKEHFRVNHIFCCLGTTMKKAGSKSAFRKVDYEYPVSIAEISKAQGADTFLLVTAMGANSKSIFYYNQVKGDVEKAILNLDFNHYCIFRPSLILGKRNESRFAEELGKQVLSLFRFLLWGPFRRYRGVQAADIASSMISHAVNNKSGVEILEPNQIRK